MSASQTNSHRFEFHSPHPGVEVQAINIQLEAFEVLTRAAWGRWNEAHMRADMHAEWRAAETRCVMVDGALAGWVRLAYQPDHDWLDLMVTRPSLPGEGPGTAVLMALMEEARRRGVPLWLSVYRINPAQRLYARLGFSVYERDPVRLLMGRPASAPPPRLLTPGPSPS